MTELELAIAEQILGNELDLWGAAAMLLRVRINLNHSKGNKRSMQLPRIGHFVHGGKEPDSHLPHRIVPAPYF